MENPTRARKNRVVVCEKTIKSLVHVNEKSSRSMGKGRKKKIKEKYENMSERGKKIAGI
jgi:hypothetical protein